MFIYYMYYRVGPLVLFLVISLASLFPVRHEVINGTTHS